MNYPATIQSLRLAADRSRSPAVQRAMRAGAVAFAELLEAHTKLLQQHEALIAASLVLIQGRKP